MSCFALGEHDAYIYSSPTYTKWKNLEAISDLSISWMKEHVSIVLWSAIGPGRNNYFISYLAKGDKKHRLVWGKECPPAFIKWLKVDGKVAVDKTCRVTLGPDGSFFAWDSKRIRWHNIPSSLESSVQGWLGPSGWTSGPPRIVTLGCGGAYFAITENGAASWKIRSDLTSTTASWEKYIQARTAETFKWTDLQYVTFSSCVPDQHVMLKKSLSYQFRVPLPNESLHQVMDTLCSEGQATKRRAEREASRKQKEDRKEEKKQREEEEAIKMQEEEGQRAARFAQVQYMVWRSAWEADMQNQKKLTTFPHLPVGMCPCADVSCKARKTEEGGLHACQHDVEGLLRASGKYSFEWLRKERLVWHPDTFGLRCDPDFRVELKKKATEMFVIYGLLIDKEMQDL